MKTRLNRYWQTTCRTIQMLVVLLLGAIPLLFEMLLFETVAWTYRRVAAWRGYNPAAAQLGASSAENKLDAASDLKAI